VGPAFGIGKLMSIRIADRFPGGSPWKHRLQARSEVMRGGASDKAAKTRGSGRIGL
jgi:hypothetical protein